MTKNNHRRLLVALFNFAKNEGWLHADKKIAAERLAAYKVKEREVEIFTPAEVARLLAMLRSVFCRGLCSSPSAASGTRN